MGLRETAKDKEEFVQLWNFYVNELKCLIHSTDKKATMDKVYSVVAQAKEVILEIANECYSEEENRDIDGEYEVQFEQRHPDSLSPNRIGFLN